MTNPKLRMPAVEALGATVQQLKAPMLRRLSRGSFRLYQALTKDLTTEQRREIAPIADHVAETWRLFYQEEDRRKLVAAERADKGEVLFETFYPRRSAYARPEVLRRTPHRRLEWKFYQAEPFVSVVSPDDWLKDFQKAQVAA